MHVIRPPKGANPLAWNAMIERWVKAGLARPVSPSLIVPADQLDRQVDTDHDGLRTALAVPPPPG